jgi:hypothetical protein
MRNTANEKRPMRGHRVRATLKNEPNRKDLEIVVKVLNATDERSAELKNLVERWKASGPNLQNMVHADEDLEKDLREAWPAEWLPSAGARAFYVLLPGTVGHDDDTPSRRARLLFAALVANSQCDLLGGPCDRCHRYFLKSRRSQKRFCGQRCASLDSAKRSTAAKATAEREALLESAARFWSRWTERKHPIRSLWIARRVNAAPKKMKVNGKWKRVARTITQKWISRNKVSIESWSLERKGSG